MTPATTVRVWHLAAAASLMAAAAGGYGGQLIQAALSLVAAVLAIVAAIGARRRIKDGNPTQPPQT